MIRVIFKLTGFHAFWRLQISLTVNFPKNNSSWFFCLDFLELICFCGGWTLVDFMQSLEQFDLSNRQAACDFLTAK